MERMSVTLEVSRLSGWLNARAPCRIEHRRADEERMRCVLTEGDHVAKGAQGTCGSGVEMWTSGHTQNMLPMSVTLDVFQLDTFSLNVSRSLNSPFMSVIEETPHSEMGPYIILAEAELMLLHSRTAVFREALVVKVHAPRSLQAEPYAVTNAALLAHAQRVRSLLLADNPDA